MSIDRPTLDEFIRHAESYVSELVYETPAQGYLNPKELGMLSLALQRIDRRWKLGRAHRSWLALALDELGLADAEIYPRAQLSRVTLYRLRGQRQQVVAQVADATLNSAQPSGEHVSKTSSPTGPSGRPEVKHERR